MAREFSPGLRVLIVEDELLIRWSLTEMLRACGATVTDCAAARDAVERLHRGRDFDVAVLDLRLPDCGDLRLAVLVREALPAARVILMTAFGTPELSERAHAIGVAHVVDKPFDLDRMAALIFGLGDPLSR
jgi:DNA-binding NtrC family response regulator